MKVLLFASLVSIVNLCFAQSHSFPFGNVTYNDLKLISYDKDTSASAVILKEFGEAYIESDNNFNLILDYHVQIKILKKDGLSLANYEIPLYISEVKKEEVRSIKASTFNIENNAIKETPASAKNIFLEHRDKHFDVKKIVLPNVQVGSIIEIHYELESPFIYNFREWQFQAHIPKVSSEFWATIPANYRYNISLSGFLKLTKNKDEVLKEYFTPNGRRADCVRYMWAIDNVPSFKEEEFMTAPTNFISAIHFELSQIEYFDGRKDKITKEWKDVEDELRRDERFGLQMKRGKEVIDDVFEAMLEIQKDSLIRAQKIYEFVRDHYRWNGNYGKYSELGIKKAFYEKTGNVGDINLSLVAALKHTGIKTEAMILSTRKNGLPTELFPVLSDFNYVIAKVTVAGKVYLLDATDHFLPFGLIPEHCLNGKGRVIGQKESYWFDLTATTKRKFISVMNFTMTTDGKLRGTVQTNYTGYKAIQQRKRIYDLGSVDEYKKSLASDLGLFTLKTLAVENEDDYSKPLIEKFEVELDDVSSDGNNVLFNPFIIERWDQNPFKSAERLYPVDFGAPIEEVIVFNFELPENYEFVDLPSKVGLSLPENGGRYLFNINADKNKLTMNNSLTINRSVYSSAEYHYLKELFNHIVQVQGNALLIKKKI